MRVTYGPKFDPPPAQVDHGECPQGECVPDGWCLHDPSTWDTEFESTDREQVRRAYLQAREELRQRTGMGDYMGTREDRA